MRVLLLFLSLIALAWALDFKDAQGPPPPFQIPNNFRLQVSFDSAPTDILSLQFSLDNKIAKIMMQTEKYPDAPSYWVNLEKGKAFYQYKHICKAIRIPNYPPSIPWEQAEMFKAIWTMFLPYKGTLNGLHAFAPEEYNPPILLFGEKEEGDFPLKKIFLSHLELSINTQLTPIAADDVDFFPPEECQDSGVYELVGLSSLDIPYFIEVLPLEVLKIFPKRMREDLGIPTYKPFKKFQNLPKIGKIILKLVGSEVRAELRYSIVEEEALLSLYTPLINMEDVLHIGEHEGKLHLHFRTGLMCREMLLRHIKLDDIIRGMRQYGEYLHYEKTEEGVHSFLPSGMEDEKVKLRIYYDQQGHLLQAGVKEAGLLFDVELQKMAADEVNIFFEFDGCFPPTRFDHELMGGSIFPIIDLLLPKEIVEKMAEAISEFGETRKEVQEQFSSF